MVWYLGLGMPDTFKLFGMFGADARAMGGVLDVLHCNIKRDTRE